MKRGINRAEASQGDPRGYGAPAEAGPSQQAERGRGTSRLEQLHAQGTKAGKRGPPLPPSLCSPVQQAGPREDTLGSSLVVQCLRPHLPMQGVRLDLSFPS